MNSQNNDVDVNTLIKIYNQKISTQLQNSQLVILPKVKHSILLENPDTVSLEILNFLLNF